MLTPEKLHQHFKQVKGREAGPWKFPPAEID